MNEPPDHTALFNAANLLSSGGITLPKCFLTISGYSFTAVSVSAKITPCFCKSPLNCDIQFQIHTVHRLRRGTFAQPRGCQAFQRYSLLILEHHPSSCCCSLMLWHNSKYSESRFWTDLLPNLA